MLKNKLAEILHERGITQAELARGIGVRANTVNEWVRNERQPSGKGLEALCIYFGAEPGDIMYIDQNDLQKVQNSRK